MILLILGICLLILSIVVGVQFVGPLLNSIKDYEARTGKKGYGFEVGKDCDCPDDKPKE
jgi:hypothetical protein